MATGNFSHSCGNVRLRDERYLRADCLTVSGNKGNTTELDLSLCYANEEDGSLTIKEDGDGFGVKKCLKCDLWDNHTLACMCTLHGVEGNERGGSVDLDEVIENFGGVLGCFSSRGKYTSD
ncbi:Cyanovirin-N [Aspergillus alliaceus]|uniref:Cyanovirin-N n=1 Tax=Petromyces alliaceus TaxID=209559 RepID=A0A5N7BQZ9_PETAA|nr:Cyanovirin-N [Aspergillus alliaceus]